MPVKRWRALAPEGVEERVDHGRVELRARAGLDLPKRVLRAHRVPVRPVAGHRAEGVADRDDPARERDARAAAAVGVAAAVPALVVEADDRRDRLEARNASER